MKGSNGNHVTANEDRGCNASVFSDLFCLDRDAPKNLLGLYNALFGKNLPDVSAIGQVCLENVLSKNKKTDIAFTAMGKRVILGEHQGMINPNLPVHMLMYIFREYERIVPPDVKFSKRLYQIPEPVFIVFYNGLEPYPAEQVLSLSDAYAQEGGPCMWLNLKVRVVNINTGMGHPVLDRCDILRQYSRFNEIVREHGTEPGALSNAVDDCIRRGILTDYLSRKGDEVVNMLSEECSYEKNIAVKQREAAEEAREEGRKEGLEKGCEEGRKEGLEKGREEARKEGREEGRKEGEARFVTLVNRLVSENLTDDLRRATSDEAFRQELYEKYSI